VPVQSIPMQSAPPMKRRLGDYVVSTGEAFILASREDDPDEGKFVHPRFWRSDTALYINWKFDQDMLDPYLPNVPNGRYSTDGARTWQRQTTVAPPGYKVMTGPNEVTAYWQTYAVPGTPNQYRMATWRSTDGGVTWGEMSWTPITFPDTRGIDIYDAPDGYKRHSPNYKSGITQRPEAPAHIEAMYEQAGTRKRGPDFHRVQVGPDGTLYSLTVAHILPDGDKITDDDQFWEQLDWTRAAIVIHVSTDSGRTWTYNGIVAFDEHHDIIEFDEQNLFSEPAMVIFPDGEMLCMMRTGSNRPLYVTRSKDSGVTWSKPEPISVRGIYPHVYLMHDQVLVLATGRPGCTLHFSLDRGKTWAGSEVLFDCNELQDDIYARSTCNVDMTVIDDNTLLYIHDALRTDPTESTEWLRKSGHGRVVGRLITVKPCTDEERNELPDEAAVSHASQTQQLPHATATDCGDVDIELNGRLDAPFWQSLPVYQLVDLVTGEPPKNATTFQIGWTDGALYLGVRCEDSDMKNLNVTATDYDDGDIWNGDLIELLIRTPAHTYYQIDINPVGAVVDVDRENGIERRWCSGIQVAPQADNHAWSITARMPITTADHNVDPFQGVVGSKPTQSEPWRFNLCRQRVREHSREDTAFSPAGFPWFHELSRFATLSID